MVVKDEKILVTGGNDGLGYEIAKQLISKGSRVVILGKDTDRVNNAVKKLDTGLVSSIVCDIRDEKQVMALSGRVDDVTGLVNCAGVIAYKLLWDHRVESIREIVEVNLLGTIFMTKLILPILQNQIGRGVIVNVSSTTGLTTGGHANQSVYAASKHGVRGFTDALKKDLDEEKSAVRVMGFYPGGMNTSLFAKAGLDKDTGEYMDPVEVAKVVVFMLSRPEGIKMDHVVVNRNKNI